MFSTDDIAKLMNEISLFLYFYINLCSKQFKDMKKTDFFSLKKMIRP